MSLVDPQIKRLAAVAYGEASTLNDINEITGIEFAVANRARAWGGKTISALLSADPNYTYAINGSNQRYEALMRMGSLKEINSNEAMAMALAAASKAIENVAPDPSNGAFWWDGVDFKTNYKSHPKVKDGFRFSDPAHNIFNVEEKEVKISLYWKARNRKTGAIVDSKLRGQYSCVWVSTAAYGKTIFWTHDAEYLRISGGKAHK